MNHIVGDPMKALYIKGGGWSIAFAFGVIHYLLEHHEEKLREWKWAGWSAGSLAALHMLCMLNDTDDRDPVERHRDAMEYWFKNTVRRSTKRAILNNWGDRWLEYFVHIGFIRNPSMYLSAEGKVNIGLTRFDPGIIPKPVGEIISEYKSNAHLMEVAYHSCYSPGFMQRPAVSLKKWQGDGHRRIDGLYFENKIMLIDEFDRDDILVVGRRGDGQSDISPDPDIFGHRPIISIFDITPKTRYLFEMYDNGYNQAKRYSDHPGIK